MTVNTFIIRGLISPPNMHSATTLDIFVSSNSSGKTGIYELVTYYKVRPTRTHTLWWLTDHYCQYLYALVLLLWL